jgi:hypothetical protein
MEHDFLREMSLSKCRVLDEGERMEIGKYYAGSDGTCWTPLRVLENGNVVVEWGDSNVRMQVVWPPEGLRMPPAPYRSAVRVWGRVQNLVWELTPRMYRDATSRSHSYSERVFLEQGEPRHVTTTPLKMKIRETPTSSVSEELIQVGHVARTRICPNCGEPVVGANRLIVLFDDGRSVAEMLRQTSPEQDYMAVFDGCLMCLERRLIDDPVTTALLKACLCKPTR